MIENGTLLQNRYLIGEQIGAGGMGAVYRAVDQRFDSFVAIKETFYTDDELAVAFEREARLLNSLQHPVLPHVTDYFAENNGYFLVMQFIEGEDFSDILKREGAFAPADLVRWANSLLDALDYLHSQDPPIIHRDIKPHNLKLTPRGDIILLDFGLAKLNSGETTGAVSVFGYSRTYSPLEQIQGTGTDARSDIFALGATAYHLLTGKPAVDALTRAAAIVAGKSDPLLLASEIKPEIPVGVATVIHSALALNPDQRFASAKAMRHALEYAVNEIESAKEPDSPVETAAIIAPVVPIVNSAETENFPALEAFAGAVNPPEIEIAPVTPAVEIITPQIATPAYNPVPYSTTVAEAATEVSVPRKTKSRMPLAALAAALIGGILTVFYFTAGANSTSETNQNPVVQTASASEEKPEEKSDSDSVSPAPKPEAISQTKTKPAAIEKTVVKSKSDEETLIEENADEEAAQELPPAQAPKPVPPPPVKTTRRAQPRQAQQEDSEERSRVVEDAPTSDIESIFTGQTPEANDNEESGQTRRRRGNQMSDEEREQRRERRQRRRERQNRQSFPPF
jgi:serine/threonine protein kinase